MNADTINTPDIPLTPPPNITDIKSPIPLTKNTIKTTHHAHFIPFSNPHTADINIRPRMRMEYPKIIPVDELLNPVGNEFFRVHIISKGVPGINIVIPTINANNAAINTIIATIRTPFGLVSIYYLPFNYSNNLIIFYYQSLYDQKNTIKIKVYYLSKIILNYL
jgi:hypothetical protein